MNIGTIVQVAPGLLNASRYARIKDKAEHHSLGSDAVFKLAFFGKEPPESGCIWYADDEVKEISPTRVDFITHPPVAPEDAQRYYVRFWNDKLPEDQTLIYSTILPAAALMQALKDAEAKLVSEA